MSSGIRAIALVLLVVFSAISPGIVLSSGVASAANDDTAIDGYVTDAAGNAVGGATVEIRGVNGTTDGNRTVTNETGGYSIDAVSGGDYAVEFLQRNGSVTYPTDGVVDVHPLAQVEAPARVDERLPRGHQLNVTVVNGTGAPVENASVLVAKTANGASAGDRGSTGGDGMLVYPGSDGPGIEVNGTVDVEVRPPEGSDLSAERTELTVSSATDRTVTLESPTTATGSVTLADGSNATADRLEWRQTDGGGYASNVTSPTGAYSAELERDTRYEVAYEQVNRDGVAFPSDGSPDVYAFGVLETGTDDVSRDHSLPLGSNLSVTVVDGTGEPVPDATVHVGHENGGAHASISAPTDQHGRLNDPESDGPGVEVDGTVTLHVQPPSDRSLAPAGTDVEVTEPTDVTVELEETVNVSGEVHDANGDPVADEMMTFESTDGGERLETWTDSGGNFTGNAIANETTAVGFRQVVAGGEYESDFEADNVPDLYALGTITADSDRDLGSMQLPAAHNVSVTVVDESGTAVADARVELLHRNDSARQHASRLTNGSGGTSFEGVGAFDVYVEPPSDSGLGSESVQLTVDSEDDVTIVLPDTVSVSGQIRFADGTAAENWRVSVVGTDGTEGGDAAITDANGTFTAEVPANGTYEVGFAQENDGTGVQFPTDGRPDLQAITRIDVGETDVSLGPVRLRESHPVNVTVETEAGERVTDADVHVSQDDRSSDISESRSAALDSNGEVVLDGASTPGVELNGTMTVHVRPGDPTLAPNGTAVTVHDRRNVTITVERTVNVSGRFEYADGSPAAGWQAEVYGIDGTRSGDSDITNATGAFTTHVAENGTYDVGFLQKNYRQDTEFPKDGNPDLYAHTSLTVGTDDVPVSTVRLPEPHLVNVTVVTSDGAPVTSADVFVGHRNESTSTNVAVYTSASLDESGEVVLRNAPAPGVELNGTLYVNVQPDDPTITGNETTVRISDRRNVTIVVDQTVNVSGRVLEPDGTAAAEEKIRLNTRTGDDATGSTWTDADGYFVGQAARNETVDVGFYQVAAEGDREPSFDVDGVPDLYALGQVNTTGDTDLGTAHLPSPHNVTVHAVDSNGGAVADATVFLNHRNNDSRVHADRLTDASGNVSFEGVGTFDIHVRPPDGAALEAGSTRIDVTGPETVTVELRNVSDLSGQWAGPDGEPIDNERTGAFNFTTGVFENSETDANGNFTFGVPDGTYSVNVLPLNTGDGIVDAWAVADVTVDGPTDIGHQRLPRGYEVTLRAEDDGETVDAFVGPRGGNGTWIYEYTSGRNLDPGSQWWNDVTTRELANGTHRTAVRDSWTKDRLLETNVTVEGAPVNTSLPVNEFGETDVPSGDGVVVARDLETPYGPTDSPESLLADAVNVRLWVVNSTPSTRVRVTEQLPDGHTYNDTYGNDGLAWDGNGTVTIVEYDPANETLTLDVEGEVTQIRYRVDPVDAGSYAVWTGTYDVGTDGTTEATPGDQQIGTIQDVTVNGTVVNATGSGLEGYVVANDHEFVVEESTAEGDFELGLRPDRPYSVGFVSHDRDGQAFAPRDGTVDVYEFATVNSSADVDLGENTIPDGHVLDVRVLDASGDPVHNASVAVRHDVDPGLTPVGLVDNTTSEGYLQFRNASNTGLEVTGDVAIRVRPPTDEAFVDDTRWNNVTVTSDRTVAVELERNRTDVPLAVVANATRPVAGDPVQFTVTRQDTGEPVDANVTVDGTTDATGSDGEIVLTFDEARERAVVATKDRTKSERYLNDSVSVDVREPANVSVASYDVSNTTVDPGEVFGVNATVENTGEANGTLTVTLTVDGASVESRSVDVPANGTATVGFTTSIDEPGDHPVTVNDEPATTVHVRRPATFDVSGLDAPAEAVQGESIPVTAAVENVGEREGTQVVEYVRNGSSFQSENVTLAPGENATVSFEVSVAGVAAGAYVHGVASTDDSATADLRVLEKANLSVSGYEVSGTTVEPNEPVAVNATVENTGDERGNLTVTLTADGSANESREVSVAGGDTTTVSFTAAFSDPGTHTVRVNGLEPTSVEVLEPANFTISTTDAPAEVVAGETYLVNATIENVGDLDGTQTVTYQVAPEDGGSALLVGESVTLAGGATTEVTYELTEGVSRGNYTQAVETDNATTTADLRALEPANFTTTYTVEDKTVLTTERVNVTATVENTGDLDGTTTVTFRVNGSAIGTTNVTVAAGESEPVAFGERIRDAGTYAVTVNERTETLVEVNAASNADASVAIDAPSDGAVLGESPTLQWTYDNVSEGIDHAEYVVDGGSPREVDLSTTSGDLALSDGGHNVTVYLVDNVGNHLSTETVHFDVDTTPPTVTVNPARADDVGVNRPVAVDVTAVDDHPATTELLVESDSGVVYTRDISDEVADGETTVRWNGTDAAGDALANGDYTLAVASTDAVGRTASSTATVRVDNDPPTVTVTGVGRYDAATTSGTVYTNDTVTFEATADGTPGSADRVGAVLDSRASSYQERASATRQSDGTWRAELDVAGIPDDGTYDASALVLDTANNLATNGSSVAVVVDRTAPSLGASVQQVNGTHGRVNVTVDEPLRASPDVTVTLPDGSTAAVTTRNVPDRQRYTGHFELGESGPYEVAATGVDRTGNRGRTTSNAVIVTNIQVDDRTATVVNERTETFVRLTSEQRGNASAALTVSDAPLAALSSDLTASKFLEGEFGGAFANENLSHAVIGIPVNGSELPEDVDPADVEIRRYDETTDEWEGVGQNGTLVRNVTAEAHGIDGTYYLANVTHFSTYGSTVTDTTAPSLVSTSLSPTGGEYPYGTDSVEVTVAYDDEMSGVDPSAVEIYFDGTDVTDAAGTQVTTDAASYNATGLAGTGDHTVTVVAVDEAGNRDSFTETFTVARDTTAPSVTTSGGGAYEYETDSVTVRFDYADELSGIDADAVAVAFDDGSTTDVTDHAIVTDEYAEFTAADLAPGGYNVTATVVDAAGNPTNATVPFEVAADTTAPTVTGRSISPSSDDGTFEAGTEEVTVTIAYADAESGVDPRATSLALDDGTTTDVTDDAVITATETEYVVDGLENGSTYTLTLDVVDDAGMTRTETVQFSVADPDRDPTDDGSDESMDGSDTTDDTDSSDETDDTPDGTDGGPTGGTVSSGGGPTATATPTETGPTTPTVTATSPATDSETTPVTETEPPTATETAVPTATPASTDSPTASVSPTPTAGNGPGFGGALALVALVLGVLLRRRD